ncbi:MAG: nucleoside hydrolase [Halanaerobiales bacterium]
MIEKKIPVILDTDIGSDIDDTWALIMMLNSPELDIKLITTATGNPIERARIVAKLLEEAGRTDIPIGIGVNPGNDHVCNQAEWVEDYSLDDYPGIVYEDGVDAMVEMILDSDEEVTLTCIGPLPNIGEALRREPEIVENARFVGMHGSIYKGYNGSNTPDAETNVRLFTDDCQLVFESDWDMTITPLDTCGIVYLDGEDYQKVYHSDNPLLKALMENNKIFAKNCSWMDYTDYDSKSTTLFDNVAIYLSYSEELLEIEDLNIMVTDDGMTKINSGGKLVHCAVKWKNIDGFKKHLVSRLLK